MNDPVNLADLTGEHYTMNGTFTSGGKTLPKNPVSGTTPLPPGLTPIMPGDRDFGEGVDPPLVDPTDPFDPARGAYPGRKPNIVVHPEEGGPEVNKNFWMDEETGDITPLPDTGPDAGGPDSPADGDGGGGAPGGPC